MSEPTDADTSRELLPLFTADEARRLVIQLTTLAGYVPSARDEAQELIALLGERMAPSGVLKRYALWISPWERGRLLYRITRRDRPGMADEPVARFVSEPMAPDDAIAYGRATAVTEHGVPEDELDIHPIDLLASGEHHHGARGDTARKARKPWSRVKT